MAFRNKIITQSNYELPTFYVHKSGKGKENIINLYIDILTKCCNILLIKG